MTDTHTIDEQLSAFADGELPRAEAELLLARLARDPALRARWERYHAIGESLRNGLPARYPRGLAAGVGAALVPKSTAPITSSMKIGSIKANSTRPCPGLTLFAGRRSVRRIMVPIMLMG